VERKRVNWLWPGRVPMGKVTLLVGDPGQGKSLLSLDVAARVTTGAAWPEAPRTAEGGCATSCAAPGNVVGDAPPHDRRSIRERTGNDADGTLRL